MKIVAWIRTAVMQGLLLAAPLAVANAEAGPSTASFTVDGDYGSVIDQDGNLRDDGISTRFVSQGAGKLWEHWPEAYMGAQSYKVRVISSPLPINPDANDRSEQKVLSGWSMDDGARYFTLAFYIPTFATFDNWLMLCQWWQDPTRTPPLSLGLGQHEDGTHHLYFTARTDDDPWEALFDDGPVVLGQWYRFMMRVDFGLDGDGSVALWKMNNVTGQWEEKVPLHNRTLGWKYRSDGSRAHPSNLTWKVGTYRGSTTKTTRIYYDNVRTTDDRWNAITNSRTIGYRRNVLDLRFDEADGNEVLDTSGRFNRGWTYDNHGTLQGAVRVAACGSLGSCLHFAGNGEHVAVPVDKVDFDTGNYLTLGAFFGTSHSQTGKGIVTIDRYSFSYKSKLYWVSDNTVSFAVRHPDGSLSEVQKTFPFRLTDNVFRHLAGTYNRFAEDGKRLKLYLNGQLVATNEGSDKPVWRGDDFLYVGKFSEEYFKGFIDEVTMFNYELTPDEIRRLFTCYVAGGEGCP